MTTGYKYNFEKKTKKNKTKLYYFIISLEQILSGNGWVGVIYGMVLFYMCMCVSFI
jgi:hypothetical protein